MEKTNLTQAGGPDQTWKTNFQAQPIKKSLL